MSIFRLPFLNWLILNTIAFYALYAKNILAWSFSGWTGVLGILVALESFGWIAASLYYFYRFKTSPNPISPATA
ncbi:isoprenylcysteine carboxylmethyltransferase family protein, partial [Providencia stuartii]|nr:isoprenylcysteine carboxylmethyltransferase family protein [Providencia stuartii]